MVKGGKVTSSERGEKLRGGGTPSLPDSSPWRKENLDSRSRIKYGTSFAGMTVNKKGWQRRREISPLTLVSPSRGEKMIRKGCSRGAKPLFFFFPPQTRNIPSKTNEPV
jgi:hypothetical protein